MKHVLLRAMFAAVTAGACAAAGVVGSASGHHSLVMYDREHPIELVGTVREFKFVSPHALIVLEVMEKEAPPVIWHLEGDSPNSLSWDGWSHETLRPGDELRLTVTPLRSGAHGGGWHARNTTYKDGTPITVMRGR
jgi:Family of unknown function (DUF6152)